MQSFDWRAFGFGLFFSSMQRPIGGRCLPNSISTCFRMFLSQVEEMGRVKHTSMHKEYAKYCSKQTELRTQRAMGSVCSSPLESLYAVTRNHMGNGLCTSKQSHRVPELCNGNEKNSQKIKSCSARNAARKHSRGAQSRNVTQPHALRSINPNYHLSPITHHRLYLIPGG